MNSQPLLLLLRHSRAVCVCVCVCFLPIPGISLRTTFVACDCASACQSRVLLFREVSLLGTKGILIYSSLLKPKLPKCNFG